MKKMLALAATATAAVLMLSACSPSFGGEQRGRDHAENGKVF
ncbi:hypothetical protein ACNSPU_03575 [Bacillus velezensis]